jgi:hypothetical protein
MAQAGGADIAQADAAIKAAEAAIGGLKCPLLSGSPMSM